MATSNIVPGGCDQPSLPSGNTVSSSAVSSALDVVGGLAQAALSGNFSQAISALAKQSATGIAKKAAIGLLTKLVSTPPPSKPVLPPRFAQGKVAPPGSASGSAGAAILAAMQTAASSQAAASPSTSAPSSSPLNGGSVNDGPMCAEPNDETKRTIQIESKTAASVPGHDNMSAKNPGHANILIGVEDAEKQMSYYETYGLWPSNKSDNFLAKSAGCGSYGPGNDVCMNYEGDDPLLHDYPFVSKPVPISPEQYQALQDFNQQQGDFQVFSNNCVDYAVSAYNHVVGNNAYSAEQEYWTSSPRKLGDDIIAGNADPGPGSGGQNSGSSATSQSAASSALSGSNPPPAPSTSPNSGSNSGANTW